MDNTKFAIGCLVQWYEIEMISEYIDSLKDAVDNYDGEVKLDFTFCTNQDLEKVDSENRMLDIIAKFYEETNKLVDYDINVTTTKELITIADYRRTFNESYCDSVDVLVWGESDMLVPKQMFQSLNLLHQTYSDKTPKYLATFAICKMWDDSWKPLEHVDFTDKPFIEGDTENWWSLRYTMSIEEMNQINSKVSSIDLTMISPHKFNGCGMVISSEVIKSGVNIPRSVFFVHEDTAFMMMTQKVLGNIPQYHFRNILVVHNRKHPKKRNYVLGEEGIDKTNTGAQRAVHDWYTPANKMCEQNVYNLFNPNYKSFNWKDVWN